MSDRVVEYVAENDGVLDGVMVSEGDTLSDGVSDGSGELDVEYDGDGDGDGAYASWASKSSMKTTRHSANFRRLCGAMTPPPAHAKHNTRGRKRGGSGGRHWQFFCPGPKHKGRVCSDPFVSRCRPGVSAGLLNLYDLGQCAMLVGAALCGGVGGGRGAQAVSTLPLRASRCCAAPRYGASSQPAASNVLSIYTCWLS